MHKITKGLKKKKKGKKSKHKDEELFKPEELEAYRQQHQQQAAAAATAAAATEESSGSAAQSTGQNEEWKKFISLTSGVDDILKKTQSDLDRIKSTSFFQRVPPPSQVKKEEEEAALEQKLYEEQQQAAASTNSEQESIPADIGIVQVSESESEEEEEDDIFDTAYIDAIAAGEVKLAYIPESPTQETCGDDPFDTSIAERAILGPTVERKGKKLVPLGAATVEVLTGRVQIPTCATQRPVSNRRQILKERDLLLGSFDDNANSIANTAASPVSSAPKTLLDEDAPLCDEPIDLAKPIHPPTPAPTTEIKQLENPSKNIVNEFDVINNIIDDEDDEEFAALAAESLTKAPTVAPIVPPAVVTPVAVLEVTSWAAFGDEKSKFPIEDAEGVDPFDTTFAENILPGKAELKIIENEILNEDLNFDPRATDDKVSEIINKVSIKITDPAGQRESISSLDRVSEADLNLIKPVHRDLLGGSNTDLSNIGDQPLTPAEKPDDNYIEYCDPFDTSIVETVQLPGQTELKFLEKELLGDLRFQNNLLDEDDDFNPRGAEDIAPKERTLSRPDVLNISSVKTVSFDLPTPPSDLLSTGEETSTKKPLTPFYVRKHSIPEEVIVDGELNADPFDTSFIPNTAPSRAELKYIESELFDPNIERRLSVTDQDFDPRDEKKVKIEQVVQSIKEISAKPKEIKIEQPKPIDLLAIGELEVAGKVLTPAAEKAPSFDEISYIDPFDTSIAANIFPGKTELKLLESELIHSSNNLDDPDFDPRAFHSSKPPIDLLDNAGDIGIHKPLNPVIGTINSFDIADNEADIDPFDTSIANNIVPGKTELKLLESELI